MHDYDYIVVGSGFGGSVSALRLTEKGYRVLVVEQGCRWTPENLPKTTWNLRRWLWMPFAGLRGFFSLKIFRHVVVLHGNAVGGGSITYANTLLVPPERIWQQGTWAGLCDWAKDMPAHYETAKRMLGVTTNKRLSEADHLLRDIANDAGVGDSFNPTEVGVFFGNEQDPHGSVYPDPYFGGDGPERRSCNGCGGCMIGCRYGAKNSLDQNYLYLAQKRGCIIKDETRVDDIRPIGAADGSDGYRVTVRSSKRGRHAAQKVTAKGIVIAASSLGTQDLLLRLKDEGALPRLSDRLGHFVRTNAESLIGIRYPGQNVDLSKGIAIGSGIHISNDTHIEATRYPAGSDTVSLLSTVLTKGRPGPTRPLVWVATIITSMLKRPRQTFRALRPKNCARETMILLCMQTLDGHLTMRRKRRWFWPFTKQLSSEGTLIPAHIPEASEFAINAAAKTGGVAMTSASEIFLNVPMTAHCMGGAVMGADSQTGVCDSRCRVFGYENMLVCDGSVISSNLGVNPSLTITALAEHAMSFVDDNAMS